MYNYIKVHFCRALSMTIKNAERSKVTKEQNLLAAVSDYSCTTFCVKSGKNNNAGFLVSFWKQDQVSQLFKIWGEIQMGRISEVSFNMASFLWRMCSLQVPNFSQAQVEENMTSQKTHVSCQIRELSCLNLEGTRNIITIYWKNALNQLWGGIYTAYFTP